MAHQFTLPFYAFRLHLRPGAPLLLPMTDKQAVRLGQPLHLVAGQYAEELQRKVLNKGNITQLLEEYRPGDFIRHRLIIGFAAAEDGISYPAFDLEFDFFYNEQPEGYWGIIPVLEIEGFSRNLGDLAKRLEEAVKLDFNRRRRLAAVQDIISTIWFESLELLQYEIVLQAPTPREVEEFEEQPQEKLLPQVAQKLEISRQVTFGRLKELEQLGRALKNDFSRNVLVVGPSGSGKTALIWEISRQFRKRRIKGEIWETTASTLIKELTRNTGWQDNLAFLCKEIAPTDNILFVRNLMDLFEVGKYEGNEMAIADYLRNYISRGEITLISECTEEEMALIELRSPSYLSLFQVVRLEEPREDLEQIILKKVKSLADVRKVTISEDAIHEVIRLNRRFMPYSGMPGKPIRFLETMLINSKGGLKTEATEIRRQEVIRYFCEDSGMPVFMIDPAIPMDTKAIKTRFNATVFGQENAIEALVDLLASVKTALTRKGKPIASLLFAGPTGVGKTELAKVLAQFMFGSRERLTRFDMSEFSSPYTVLRLIGSDYSSDGLLTSAIRREPFSVLLFDEIEKADPTFYDLLLQILSEGRLTDSQGKLVNFCSTIIIMTSNIGADKLRGQGIGWKRGTDSSGVKDHFLHAVQQHFRPELYNRIDRVVPFEPLDQLTVRYVVEREIDRLRQREGIQFRRMKLTIAEEVLDYLGQHGYDDKYGARHLQRTIREAVIIPLARKLNAHDPEDQLVIEITLENGKPHIHDEADPLSVELLLEELNKIDHADQCSAFRRGINQLMEGHFYVHLINELQLLERRKKRLKKQFWENRVDADRYTHFLESKEKTEKLKTAIEDMEMTLSLATLGSGVYNTRLPARLETWEMDFFNLKMELYTRLTDGSDRCFIGIYGKNPHRTIFNLYFRALKMKEFSFSAKSIWFREAYYKERAGELRYLKAALDLEALPEILPPEKGDELYGIEIDITGPAAFLYFSEEAGFQLWQTSEKKYQVFLVQVENKSHATPEKIHRREFYRARTARRTVEAGSLKDSLYQINREVETASLETFLVSHLDRRFEVKLNMELL